MSKEITISSLLSELGEYDPKQTECKFKKLTLYTDCHESE